MMDEINATKNDQEPKNNTVLFFVLGIIIILIIACGGYIWWKTQTESQKENNKTGQEINNKETENQSVLNIFGQIEKIDGKKFTVKDGNNDKTMTFTWTEAGTISKENLDSTGFSKISFNDLKKGQTVSAMYQNNADNTLLSIVLMGGTNLVGEVVDVTNNQIQITNQGETFLIKIGEKTNILRLGKNDKMEDKLPINEIKKGDYVSIVAEDGLNTDSKTVVANKIEILSQE